MKRHNPASSRVSGSSVVEDLMIHDVDIMKNVLLPDGAYRLAASGNEDLCSALFSFGETSVYLSASRKSSKKIRMIYIEEEEFTIEGDFMAQEIYIHRKPGQYAVENERYVQENIIEKVLVNKQEPLKLELSTFLGCVARGREFPVSPAQALLNMEICEDVARCFTVHRMVSAWVTDYNRSSTPEVQSGRSASSGWDTSASPPRCSLRTHRSSNPFSGSSGVLRHLATRSIC
ncbi:MAG: hypothetical protein RJR34_09460 [Candidatus Methanoculleus thermohydrogenotrophicum]|nr:hypothetical protein [Candidatus Methanoculleus thermohydrogenotrophicum]